MTKEEILKEIEEIKDAIFASNRRIDVLETELKELIKNENKLDSN